MHTAGDGQVHSWLTIFSIVFGFAFSGLATACECSYPPLTAEAFAGATQVAVVRVKKTSAEVGPGEYRAEGQFISVHSLAGAELQEHTFLYSRHWCCGASFEAGFYYLVALRAGDWNDGTLLLHPGNAVHLGIEFSPTPDSLSELQSAISEAKAGNTGAEVARQLIRSHRANLSPPPPHPPLLRPPQSHQPQRLSPQNR
jgi:hypothetical protein